MAFSNLQGQSPALVLTAVTSFTFSFTSPITVHSLLVVDVTFSGGGNYALTVSDPSNGTWVEDTGCNQYDSTAQQCLRRFYVKDAVAGSPTITVDAGGNTIEYYAAQRQEWSGGLNSSDPKDNSTSAQGTSGNPASGTLTVGVDNCLILSTEMDSTANNTVGISGSFTKWLDDSGDASGGMCSEYWKQGSKTNTNSGWTYTTTTHRWMCCITSFKPAASTAKPTGPFPTFRPDLA